MFPIFYTSKKQRWCELIDDDLVGVLWSRQMVQYRRTASQKGLEKCCLASPPWSDHLAEKHRPLCLALLQVHDFLPRYCTNQKRTNINNRIPETHRVPILAVEIGESAQSYGNCMDMHVQQHWSVRHADIFLTNHPQISLQLEIMSRSPPTKE